ncbi:MAG: hypothetical protein LBQ52_01915, partial [Helicobacteraceae bacterium]|jgi:hypothetical protein|nr:hypothetical protein [Helicobacteraceae bacterium]
LERNASASNANSINVSGSPIAKIEYVEINVKLSEPYDNNCGFNLTLKRGDTDAVFMKDDRSYNIFVYGDGYRFATPRFLDENADGTWSLTLDRLAAECPSDLNIIEWKIRVRGRN